MSFHENSNIDSRRIAPESHQPDPALGIESDLELTSALRNFRSSVHTWSEREYARSAGYVLRQPLRWWQSLLMPTRTGALAIATACLLAIVGITVPMAIHRSHGVAHSAAQGVQAPRLDQASGGSVSGSQVAAGQDSAGKDDEISDEQLMAHVDSDVAQEAPDAMQPLADLMSGSTISTRTSVRK